MNPFLAPKNYSQMLLKIATCTFLWTLLVTCLIAYVSPAAKRFLGHFSVTVSVAGIESIPIGYFAVAVIVALLFRVLKVHDRVSDVFGIRKRFDIQEILIPLAGGVGKPVTLDIKEHFDKRRDELMRRIYYKYASSTQPQIDPHIIIMALDRWSWFWILIESIVVSFFGLVALFALKAYPGAAIAATYAFLATLAATFTNRACAPLAHAQVQIVLENPTWQGEIKAALNAL